MEEFCFCKRGRKPACPPLPAKIQRNGINRTPFRCVLPSLKLSGASNWGKGIASACLILCIFVGIYTFVPLQFGFDQTLGFPGEGPNFWSKSEPYITMAGWNPRSLTFERFQYCLSLNCDILVLPELWRQAEKFADGTTKWIYGKPVLVNGRPKYPDDRAAGVGILLSKRAQAMLLAHGTPCERIAWGRFKGPVTNMFVIGVHMPQSARKDPAQHNTLQVLTQLLKQVPSSDCTIIIGDLNAQLAASIEGITGKWAYSSASKNAQPLIDMMRMFELVAVNTLYQPKKKQTNVTFVQNVSIKDDSNAAANPGPGPDQKSLVGKSLSVKYKGKNAKGK